MSDTNTPKGDAPAPQAEPVKKPEADTLTLTPAELKAQIDAALKADRDEAKRLADEKQAEADRKSAEEKGEWKKLAEDAQKERDELKAAAKLRDHNDAIRAEVNAAAKGKEGYTSDLFDTYVTQRLISTLPVGTKAEDIAKAAKDGVEKYVADNPRQPKGSAAAPPAPRGRQSPTRQPVTTPNAPRFRSLNFPG